VNLVYSLIDQCRPIPSFVLKTAPKVEPIGKDEVKAHSRIDISDDDLLIQTKILAVRQMVERNFDLALITQTWTMYLDWLPTYCIEIWKRPVQKVNSVKYLDADGVSQTLASNQYDVDVNARPPRITPAINASWPYVQPRPAAVAVEFDAGYGDKPSDVPPNVVQYLLFKVADLYEYRESYSDLKIQPLGFDEGLIRSEALFSF